MLRHECHVRNAEIIALVFILFIVFSSLSVQADISKLEFEIDEAIQNNSKFIENSYIIGFRNPSALNSGKSAERPLIDPPEQSKRGKNTAPFGEHSTGQSKENLARRMGLRGEVISIFETINAVHVKMDAQEAERWRKDKRVAYVEQDATTATAQSEPGGGLDRSASMVFAANSIASNYPTYQDGQLVIPRVDTLDQIGSFQDAVFQFDEQIGAWKLLNFKTTIVTSTDEPQIDNVEIMITDSFPVQVFLRVNGQHFSGCGQLGQVNQQLQDNKLKVLIHTTFANIPPNTTCTQGFVRFETLIPLSVYGLSAGDYEYSVNGSNNGTFNLPNDNEF